VLIGRPIRKNNIDGKRRMKRKVGELYLHKQAYYAYVINNNFNRPRRS